MLLLCGIPSEPPLRLVIEAADALGIEYVLFNQRESHFTDISLTVHDGRITGAINVHEQNWPLDAFSGIYVRLMDYRDLPENQPHGRRQPEHQKLVRSQLLHECLIEWLEMADCRIMNRPSAMGSNISKPYQAQWITRTGFHTPPTLITNDPDAVRRFLELHGRLVYKSVSSVRSIVQELDETRLKGLYRVRYLPTQFQAFVPGVNIRAHVAGNAVFAAQIESEAVDYRYANRDGREITMMPVTLPSEIEARCRALSQALNLPLCGIDLKRTPSGDYYCFEVNPSPAYSYYQEQTDQPISFAIASYLNGRTEA